MYLSQQFAVQFLSIFTLTLAGISTSCDKVDCPYRDERRCSLDYEAPPGAQPIEYTAPPEARVKRVLLEDYTGFRCSNCPPATVTAENIYSTYPDRVVLLAAHMTQVFAAPQPTPEGYFATDFRTEAGDLWETTFQVFSLPNGMVDRQPVDGNRILQFGDWQEAVEARLNDPALAALEIRAVAFNADSTEMSFEVVVQPLATPDEQLNLVVCLLEDNLLEAQKDGTETLYPYYHNHVLRETPAGPFGTPSIGPETEIVEGIGFATQFTIPISASYNPAELNLVAFLARSNSLSVVQSAKW